MEGAVQTTTIFIRFSKLAAAGEAGLVVARAALVCNDIAMANSEMARFMSPAPPSLEHIRLGARMYFARLQCGHLNEGLKVIRQVSQNASLEALVGKCASQTQDAFRDLAECLPRGVQSGQFKAYVASLRNRVAFHYDPDAVEWAVADRASRPAANLSSMTIGQDIHSCRFEFADDLLQSIVCRKLWGIPRSGDLSAEADRISHWCFKKCRSYLRFADEFVVRFLREHAGLS